MDFWISDWISADRYEISFVMDPSGRSVQGTLLQTERCLKNQKWSPYKVKGPFSMPVCTRKQTNRPYSADQALSIASCNSRHALSAKAFVQESRRMDHTALTRPFLYSQL